MKKVLLILYWVIMATSISAHPWKPLHYIIVDTDCGMDDYRALCMLLASSDVRVLAITTSDGVLDAKTGFYKVRSLLSDLHHEGIPVGVNSDPNAKTETCFPARSLIWGPPVAESNDLPDAVAVVNHVLENTREKVVFISLGSLGTAHLCAESCPGFSQRIQGILWSSPPDFEHDNFNYNLNIQAASGALSETTPIHLISGGILEQYKEGLVKSVGEIKSRCSEKVRQSLDPHDTPYSRAICDETLPLFLHYPALFQSDTNGKLISYRVSSSATDQQIIAAFGIILSGEAANQNQVLSVFPVDSSFYSSDIQNIISRTRDRFGSEEWKAGVIASELHRHLGVYAIIGVKMGIRAKEYFGAGIDEMSVVSFAGLTPPFSCMNDGLQVSTGATLGHGLIRVDSDTAGLPQADFSYMNRKIRVSLKPEYCSGVESEIREFSRIYGLDSNIYWELVRNAAIKYWNNLDRWEIFSISER